MPRIAFRALGKRFIEHLETTGATVFIEQLSSTRPAKFGARGGDVSTECILFLWTVTPGGPPGIRSADEFRIQATNVAWFELVPGRRTMVGGWDPVREVWAFWDVRRHTRFSANGSSGLHVRLRVLENAQIHGIAAQEQAAREGREVVVAVRPDFLLWYVLHGASIHDAGPEAADVVDLLDASPEQEQGFLEAAENQAQSTRRYELVETVRAFRDARFRPLVLRAYRYRCAVCGIALKLVDAAHIIPVAHPRSIDDVTNGLGLCRLHHAAYDNALLGVRSDYSIIVNEREAARLAAMHLGSGWDSFRAALPRVITIPAAAEVRPRPEFLSIGLKHRGWPEQLIM